MRRLLQVLVVLLLTGPWASPVRGASALSVRTHPSGFVTLNPAYIDIFIRIERHPDNRYATLIVDNGEGYFSASSWGVPGVEAQQQWTNRQGPLPEGEYIVEIELTRIVAGQEQIQRARAGFLSVRP